MSIANTYAKYCPNVFVAKCGELHEKGSIIEIETKYGQIHECVVHNLVLSKDGFYYYSITRADGFNSQERAKRKAERRANAASNARKRSNMWVEKSNEGADFIRLAEPIKIGHHSEKRHRALIDRNWNRMANSIKEEKKAEAHAAKIDYWERKSTVIDLSMPESLEYFEHKLKKAIENHELLKAKPELREHSYSLTYAKKNRNELEDKVKTAKILWG